MKRWTLWFMVVVIMIAIVPWLGGQVEAPREVEDAPPAVSFQTLEVWLDTGAHALAAWQVEITIAGGQVKFVGVEGGEHREFAEAPFYDRRAMQEERLVIAAFSTAVDEKLPRGRVRVATVHLQVEGEVAAEFEPKLEAVATVDGVEIEAGVELIRGQDS